MDEFEKLLKDQPVKQQGLMSERKVESLLRAESAARNARHLRVRPRQLVAAAMLCVGFGFGLSRMTHTVPEGEMERESESPYTTIYFIDSSAFDSTPVRQAEEWVTWGEPIEPKITIGEKPSESWNPEIAVIVNTRDPGEAL